MSGAVVDTRLPRAGVARRWMLLGERTRIVVVALVSVVGFALLSTMLSSSETGTVSQAPVRPHSITDGALLPEC